MSKVHIPKRFEDKLFQGDQRFYGIVNKTIAEFGEVLEDNKLYFFEEYTDHGIKHIENVLLSSENLVTGPDILSGKDVGVYTLSVVLHDIAMQLGFDGFVQLINGQFDGVRVSEFDKHTWRELWDEYLGEAKRFNERQILNIFGREDLIVHPPDLSNKGNITNNDKKLIGEFIRRHHPRLAHEIALKGFPGGKGLLSFADGFDQPLKDLIGLIARSHGMDLRTCIDYIEDNYGRKNKRHPQGVHAVYLMILLRIADYIQIDSSRTSHTLVKLKTFSVPFSEAEHNGHLSINSVDTKYQDDPERIYVDASPADSNAYLKLKKLINDIQYELDLSWAVLGEHYGQADRPEIKFRRIISNLEEPNSARWLTYVPDSFSFKASDEIVKLMIVPLYGDNPSFGVRELLQNAVDACKEKEALEKSKGNLNYKPLVQLEVSQEDNAELYFTITDNGIGMNPGIIKNYFLMAGASYRKSNEWQRAFKDENGKTIVRRNGRFGVGLLAAFLIGKRIYVETRKTEDEYGYKFTATLSAPQINIEKDSQLAPGTRIRILIDENKKADFSPPKDDGRDSNLLSIYEGWEDGGTPKWYQWYTLSQPEIKYIYKGELFTAYRKSDPDLNEDLPVEWQAIDADGYNKIYWTYSKDFTNVPLTCNGFVIPGSDDQYNYKLPGIYKQPRISIFDHEGSLPITLDRCKISDKCSFRLPLMEDIYKDYIANALVCGNITKVYDYKINLQKFRLNYPAFTLSINHGSKLTPGLDHLLFSKKGFVLNAQYCIQTYGGMDVLYIQSENLNTDNLKFDRLLELDIKNAFVQIARRNIASSSQFQQAIEVDSNKLYNTDYELLWRNEWLDEEDREGEENGGDKVPEDMMKRDNIVFIKKEKYLLLFNTDNQLQSFLPLRKGQKVLNEVGDWVCLQIREPVITDNHIISKPFLEKKNILNFIKTYRLTKTTNHKLLNDLLEKYLGKDVVIPYEIEERRKKFPLAFKELDRYMKKYL
jgi:hypothetical protein